MLSFVAGNGLAWGVIKDGEDKHHASLQRGVFAVLVAHPEGSGGSNLPGPDGYLKLPPPPDSIDPFLREKTFSIPTLLLSPVLRRNSFLT